MHEESLFGLLAETFVHPGAGSSGGAIDLPVAREAATGYPFIAGSSLKGALRECARQVWPDQEAGQDAAEKTRLHPKVAKTFGQHDNAGQVLV